MAAPVENWDDDADFKGDFFGNSVSTVQTSFSSRISLHSESNAGDEAWDVVFASNDENSTQNAIVSAKQKGVPIPANVPSSALLGTGTITRLGKKKSRQNVDDDWGMDMELPGGTASPLKLKPQVSQDSAKRPTRPTTPSNNEDDFDLDWAEGSLGVRFGGTKRELRNRSSSTSAMSPSMGSCMTVESEEDGLDGLVVPNEPLDFNALLKKRKETEREAPAISSPQPAVSQKSPQPTPPPTAPALAAPAEVKPQSNVLKADDDEDDMLGGLDIGAELIDPKKPTYNRNIKITSNKIQIPPVRSTTTLTFTDKPPASRIPRPATTTKSTKLDPVYEPGAVQVTRTAGSRAAPTTTSSQLLRAKRSAPVLRSQPPLNSKPSIPFLPAGASSSQSHHVTAKAPPPYLGFRRDSNPDRGQSPPPRSFSRISRLDRAPDTPSRSGFRRGDLAPAALSREAMTKRNLTKPARRRNFGDGSELDLFDDLPTSASKESLFMKEPVAAGKPGQKPKLKTQSSMSRLLFGDRTRTQTPVPPPTPTTVASTATGTTFGMPTTPRGLTRFQENTPSFARDTTASRNAREQRLQNINTRSRDGPLNQVQTNWKAQVALRNPQLSPTTTRGKNKGESKRPQLISWIKPESVRSK